MKHVFSIQVISAGMNPIQIVRGIEKTAKALVSELRLMSREVLCIFFLCMYEKLYFFNSFEINAKLFCLLAIQCILMLLFYHFTPNYISLSMPTPNNSVKI